MSQDDPQRDEDLARLLGEAHRVAVIGASTRTDRPAYLVPRYLARHGFEILPVNARYAGQQLHGRDVVASVTDLEGAVDIVDVFRRSEDVPGHVDEILAMRPLPRAVWLQLGIRNDAAAETLRAAGIEVVQDRCMKVEYARLVAPKRDASAG